MTSYKTIAEAHARITWWNTFGKRVKFWMPTPEPFDAAKNEGEAK